MPNESKQISCVSNTSPKELNRFYLYKVGLFLSRSLYICETLFRTQKAQKHVFSGCLDLAKPKPHSHYIYKYIVFSSVNKICIVIAIWIFKNDKKWDRVSEASVNDCREHVCIAFVINRIGPHKNRVGFSYHSVAREKKRLRKKQKADDFATTENRHTFKRWILENESIWNELKWQSMLTQWFVVAVVNFRFCLYFSINAVKKWMWDWDG